MNKHILISRRDEGIITITLHRPERANALSIVLLEELQQILKELQDDETVRCVIITGAGEKAFCAGADLKERKGMRESEVKKSVSMIRETINKVEALPQPVIAAINGATFGGGIELALACDIRIAAEQASFGLTETSLAIIPGAGGTQRLPRLIGLGRAKELIFTARKVSAYEAEKIGLCEYVLSSEYMMEKTMDLAIKIANNGPIAIKQAKKAINDGYNLDLHTGLTIEQYAYECTIPTRDRKEGLQAFEEKRKPVYKGE